MVSRRNFIKSMSVATYGTVVIPKIDFKNNKNNSNFKASLVSESIGLKTDAHKLISQAYNYNFNAISPLLGELVSFSPKQIDNYLEKMKIHNLVFDAGGLPIQFRSDENTFLKGYDELKANLPVLSELKIPGFVTWIMPTNQNHHYIENFNIHKTRLKKVAILLKDYNMRLGLEYVGPKTLMSRDKFPFIHAISELRTLVDSIQEENVGYLLDSFHMYCSEDTIKDYNFIELNDIVSVQINDAVLGRNPAQQIDLERNLPGVTGIIDLKVFLTIIKSKGYKGRISAEPFNKKLNDMDEKEKLQTVSESIHSTFNTVQNI